MGTRDPRVDAYIARSADFARPVLDDIRSTVHEVCPTVVETMKWSFPHFDYGGMLCSMAAFQAHCAFGFWKGSLIAGLAPSSASGGESMGNLGRITSVRDLPSRKVLAGYIREAMRLNDDGVSITRRRKPASAAATAMPPELAAGLAGNDTARAVFDGFPPGERREYIEWIAGAKQDATRVKRAAQAVEWIEAGKRRNWKYER